MKDGQKIFGKDSKSVPGVPRRNCLQELNPLELNLFNLICEIENAGAHTLLTETQTLLMAAREKLADYYEQSET